MTDESTHRLSRNTSRAALAVIPARGGSKRIPRKNLVSFAGKPMIVYTIRAAVSSSIFARIVVSTDDESIAEVAVSEGAEVPFLRDPAIADDKTPVSAVTADALHRIDPDAAQFSHVAQLMANCPLRTAEDIVNSYSQFIQTIAAAQLSVVRFGWQNPWWAMRRDSQMVLRPLFEKEATARSQDLPDLFCPTGAIWWATSETLRSHKTFHVPERTGWEIAWDHAIDIDTLEDLRMAELLYTLRETPPRGAR